MCSFCARKQSRRRRLSRWSRFSEFHIDTLVVQELDYLTPMKAPRPVSPHNGIRSRRWRREECNLFGFVQWPENCTDAARFFRGCPIPLTFFTPRAGTAVTNPSSIDHAHTAISFEATLLGIQGETSRTLDRAVWLGGEVLP